MKHVLLAVVFAAACGGKSTPKTETAPASNAAATQPGDNANCVGKAGGNHNCGFEQLQLDTSTATKVEGGGRSEDCVGQTGTQHACAYEVTDLKMLGNANGTIGKGAGTGPTTP